MRDEEVVMVPMYALNMLFPGGYFAHFWKLVQGGKTHKEAWEECEAVLEKYKMPCRYSSYESFRAAKSKDGGRPDSEFIQLW